MELYETDSEFEGFLSARAAYTNQALGGTMELLPLCNMRCKMCYIYHDKAQMEKEGKMLTLDQWISIAQDLKDNGILFLLLTGGEPLLYPDFRELYTTLLKMGFILSINTNGTLIDEDMADFFAENRCRSLNVTIYGADDETYGALCGNPRGYSQVTRTIRLLKERNIRFRLNFTPTPVNYQQFETLQKRAIEWDVPLVYTSYIFPPVRREDRDEPFRLEPEQAAQMLLLGLKDRNRKIDEKTLADMALTKLNKPRHDNGLKGLKCGGGHSGFWINWKGQLASCSMIQTPSASLLERPFAQCWKDIVEGCEAYTYCSDCLNCEKSALCSPCTAKCLAETGHSDRKPEYMCAVTDAYIALLRRVAGEEI